MRYAWQYRALTWFLSFMAGKQFSIGDKASCAGLAGFSILCIFIAYELDKKSMGNDL